MGSLAAAEHAGALDCRAAAARIWPAMTYVHGLALDAQRQGCKRAEYVTKTGSRQLSSRLREPGMLCSVSVPGE